MKPGLYQGIPNSKYHAARGLSKSMIVTLDRSPAHLKTPEEITTQKQQTFDDGSAFHTYVFEPKLFDDMSFVLPAGQTFKPDINRKRRDAIRATGGFAISWGTYKNIQGMKEAVMNHEDARKFIDDAQSFELSGWWVHPDTDVLCKFRADIVTKWGCLVDLKSTVDAREFKFSNIFFDKKYHWQGFHYCQGMTQLTGKHHNDFAFIAVEKDPPHGVNVYFMDKELHALAMEETFHLYQLYAQCLEKDDWPCYQTETKYITMPRWARNKIERSIYDD